MTIEYITINWLGKHTKKVRSSQAYISINSCTELRKTVFHVSIINIEALTCDAYWRAKFNRHCVKSVQIRSFFWSVLSCIRTRKNSIFGHSSRSEKNALIYYRIRQIICVKFQNLANFFFQTWMFQITINNYQIYI